MRQNSQSSNINTTALCQETRACDRETTVDDLMRYRGQIMIGPDHQVSTLPTPTYTYENYVYQSQKLK